MTSSLDFSCIYIFHDYVRLVDHLLIVIGLRDDRSFFLSFLALSLSCKTKGDFFGLGLGELDKLAPPKKIILLTK